MAQIGKRKISKHDQYLKKLSDQLAPRYDHLLIGIPLYSKKKRLIAEIDLIGQKDGMWDIYEVKCSHRVTKAKMQLDKIKKLLPHDKVRDCFFFCGESNKLMNIAHNPLKK